MVKEKSIRLNDLKIFIIEWNNKFPSDRKFRKKYNISFNSEAHRKTNQIDIFLDLLEDSLVHRASEDYLKYNKLREEYKAGGSFLVNQEDLMSEEESEGLFDKLKKSIRKSIKNKLEESPKPEQE